MTDRRSFVTWLGALPPGRRSVRGAAAPAIVIDATPTALYQQPDGRNNLVRVAVMGLDAPAARARATDHRGTPLGTAGLRPAGAAPVGVGVRAAAHVVRREPARRRRGGARTGDP